MQPKQTPEIITTLLAIDKEFQDAVRQGFDCHGVAHHMAEEFKCLVSCGLVSCPDMMDMLARMHQTRKRQGYRGRGNAPPKDDLEYQMWKDNKHRS